MLIFAIVIMSNIVIGGCYIFQFSLVGALSEIEFLHVVANGFIVVT